jgi:hypothetical protein
MEGGLVDRVGHHAGACRLVCSEISLENVGASRSSAVGGSSRTEGVSGFDTGEVVLSRHGEMRV